MTNSEDFFAFAYPALFILGALLSIVPAYIAFKKNKNFWIWWFSTATVLAILLFVVIKAQAFSLIIYLLAIVPIASILAMFPKMRILTIPDPLAENLSAGSNLKHNRENRVLVAMLIAGAVLYCSLIFINWDSLDSINKVYFITLAAVLLLGCLGFSRFVIVFSEKAITEIIIYVVLVLFLAMPIFLKPSRAYDVLFLLGRVIVNGIYIGPVVTDLIYRNPVAGIFVLLGMCSGCVAILISLNDRYKILERIVANLPLIRLSNNPFLPVYILSGAILYSRFVFTFNLGEAGMFLWPLYYVCVGFPMILVSFAGIYLSTIVIGKSITQGKFISAVGILLCGILGSWEAMSKHLFIDYFGPPGTILISYSVTTGIVALILWIISNFFKRNEMSNRTT